MLKLNSDFEDALKVARCYGVLVSKDYTMFITENGEMPELKYKETITIDTTTNQPCIYACMKEGLRVKTHIEWDNPYMVPSKYNEVEVWDFKFRNHQADIMEAIPYIKSIKILDLDKLQGVEVTE
jgi:hypothetical protein